MYRKTIVNKSGVVHEYRITIDYFEHNRPHMLAATFTGSLPNVLHKILLKFGPMTRGKLNEITKLPRTTLYDALVKLLIKDQVKKVPVNGTIGRPPIKWKAILIN